MCTNTDCAEFIIGIIFIILAIIAFVVLLIAINKKSSILSMISFITVGATFIVGMSLLSLNQPIVTVVFLGLVAILLIVIFIFSLFNTDVVPSIVQAVVWNSKKAFGGTTIGDFANSIGVIAGVGAYAASPNPAFWWIGQIASLFALLVGLSLMFRHIQEKAQNLARFGIFGLLNAFVAVGTILSLMTPQFDSTTNMLVGVGEVAMYGLAGFWLLVFIGSIVLCFYFLSKNSSLANLKSTKAALWTLIGLFAATIALLSFDIFVVSAKPDFKLHYGLYGAYIFGLFAAVSWGVAELINLIQACVSKDVLSIIKSTLEIIGDILIIIFLSFNFSWALDVLGTSNQPNTLPDWWVMLLMGALTAFIGTVIGMVNGIIAKHKSLASEWERSTVAI